MDPAGASASPTLCSQEFTKRRVLTIFSIAALLPAFPATAYTNRQDIWQVVGPKEALHMFATSSAFAGRYTVADYPGPSPARARLFTGLARKPDVSAAAAISAAIARAESRPSSTAGARSLASFAAQHHARPFLDLNTEKLLSSSPHFRSV
jgi:hypothetical protein